MYKITQTGAFAGYADSIVHIRLHTNGCYVPCTEEEADGFCAKMAVTQENEAGTEQKTLRDTVFCLAGHTLKGDEPEGCYEQMSAAVPLTEAETALAELEAAYDAG